MLTMKFFKKSVLSFFVAISIISISFGQEEANQKERLFEKIQELKEFKETLNKIDSLKQIGYKIDFNFEILWKPPQELFEEDSSGVIALVFLNQEIHGLINDIIYVIKYDKLKEKIVAIEEKRKVGIN